MRTGIVYAAAMLLMVCGCSSKTDLERAADKLASGLHKTNVTSLFKGFSAGTGRFDGPLGGSSLKLFQTNVTNGTDVRFAPQNFGVFSQLEVCYVYFDTNDIIVGYQYMREGK
jgi:hypothetical protein